MEPLSLFSLMDTYVDILRLLYVSYPKTLVWTFSKLIPSGVIDKLSRITRIAFLHNLQAYSLQNTDNSVSSKTVTIVISGTSMATCVHSLGQHSPTDVFLGATPWAFAKEGAKGDSLNSTTPKALPVTLTRTILFTRE